MWSTIWIQWRSRTWVADKQFNFLIACGMHVTAKENHANCRDGGTEIRSDVMRGCKAGNYLCEASAPGGQELGVLKPP